MLFNLEKKYYYYLLSSLYLSLGVYADITKSCLNRKIPYEV